MTNEAIDDLEPLLSDVSIEVQLRAGYTLGEIYRTYEMVEPASLMYERVISEADTYWAPKAALAMGDLSLAAGRRSEAAAYWDQAAACSISSIRRQADARFEQLIERETEAELAAKAEAKALQDQVSSLSIAAATETHVESVTPPPAVQPAFTQPMFERPVAEQPVSEQPLSEQPLSEQPLSEQPLSESAEILWVDSPLDAEPEEIEPLIIDLASPTAEVPSAPPTKADPVLIDVVSAAPDEVDPLVIDLDDVAAGEADRRVPAPAPAAPRADHGAQGSGPNDPIVVALDDVDLDQEAPNNVYQLDIAARRQVRADDSVGGFARFISDEPLEPTDSSSLFESFGVGEVDTSDSAASDRVDQTGHPDVCLLYTSPSPRDATLSRMPSSA